MATAFNEPKYSIEASDYRCLKCEGEIQPETAFYSAVLESEELFRRENYCVKCWPSVSGGSDEAAKLFAFWRSRRPQPQAAPRRLRFDPELILQIFRRLAEREDAASSDGEALDLSTDDVVRDENRADARGSASDGSVDPPVEGAASGSRASVEPSDDAGVPASPTSAAAGDAGAATNESGGDGDAVVEEGQSEATAAQDLARIDATEAMELKFFLALLLIRKKYLTIQSTVNRDGKETLLLAERKDPERVHAVAHPHLDETRFDRLKQQIGDLLQMQF